MPADWNGGLVPADFLFGVATAGFQVEGGFNGPGEPANNWVRWERSGRVEPSGIACDFWEHPEEALDRAASLGCEAFRLSVEWARLEPEEDRFDQAALDRYGRILAMCRERGMAPVVTLHHFTHPWWLGEEFWLTPGSPDRFAEHVARVVPALSPWCRHWVTVNEPNIVALMGWVEGSFPPGRRGAVADAWAVVDNLLTAHVLAARVIRGVQADALVTTNTSASSVYDYDRMLVDLLLAPALGVDRDDLDGWIAGRRRTHNLLFPPEGAVERSLRSLFAAASPYGHGSDRRRRGRAPRRVVAASYQDAGPGAGGLGADGGLGAVGFDWYDPVAAHAVQLPGRRTAGGRRWDPGRALWDTPAHPGGLDSWCADQARLTPGLPLWVVENGMATRVRRGLALPRPDGWDRPRYLREHVAAVVRAAGRGVPVAMYLHWSLVDNYEWGSYEPRFGIFGLDRARGPRGIRWLDTDAAGRDAAAVYRSVIAGVRAGDPEVLRVAPAVG